MNEYESEPVRGLPEALPEGERMVWQGAPDWRHLARRAFHVRKVALYFALLTGIHAAVQLNEGAAPLVALKGATWLVLLGTAAVSVLGLLAWLYARTTVYTITSERLVLRFGVAIPMMINLPWEKVDAADLKRYPDGAGDIVLTLRKGERISYWLLWPHAKPWRFSPVMPTLRCLADAQEAAARLGRVLGAGQPAAGASVRTSVGAGPGAAADFGPAAGARTAAMS
jgi:hypothetical protein